MAALSVVFPVQLALTAFAQGFGIGGATLIGKDLGSGRLDQAGETLKNTLLLTGAASLCLGGTAFLFLPGLVRSLGASALTETMARSYGSVVLLGSPLLSFSIAANAVARAEGRAGTAMRTLAISAGTNVILDPVFIKILGLGVEGAAWATVISQAGSAIWMGHYLRKHSSMKIQSPYFNPDWAIIRGIVSIGSSAFVRQGAGSITTACLNRWLSTSGGDPAVAAMGVLGRITNLSYMPLFGLVQGMMPIVSHNIGAGLECRVLKTVDISITWATLFCSAGAAILVSLPSAVLSPFSSGETLAVALAASPYVALSMPLAGFQVVLSGTYQALGRGKTAFILDLSRRVLIIIPLAAALGDLMGTLGIFAALPLSEIVSGTIALFMFKKVRRILKRACLSDRPRQLSVDDKK